MQILPLHPLLAAEIRDFSLDQFEESDWRRIIESLKKYSVLVFRNQEIDNEAQIRLWKKGISMGCQFVVCLNSEVRTKPYDCTL